MAGSNSFYERRIKALLSDGKLYSSSTFWPALPGACGPLPKSRQ
jgi:hypothetical protein